MTARWFLPFLAFSVVFALTVLNASHWNGTLLLFWAVFYALQLVQAIKARAALREFIQFLASRLSEE